MCEAVHEAVVRRRCTRSVTAREVSLCARCHCVCVQNDMIVMV